MNKSCLWRIMHQGSRILSELWWRPWYLDVKYFFPCICCTLILSLFPSFSFFTFSQSIILVHSWFVSIWLGYIWLCKIGVLRFTTIFVLLYLIDWPDGIEIRFALFPLFFSYLFDVEFNSQDSCYHTNQHLLLCGVAWDGDPMNA